MDYSQRENKRAGGPPKGQAGPPVLATTRRGEAGFSLLELIIVMLIIVILLLAVVLVVNPVQMLGRAWDSERQVDLTAIQDAIEFFAANDAPLLESGGWDPDGSLTDRCVGEMSQTVFVSVLGIDTSGTCACPPNDLPTGWSYRCAPNDGPLDVDGTGWLPIDLTNGGAVNPAVSHFPDDPANTFASGHYYTYVCSRNRDYELTARMTSEKFRTGGESDIQSTDGGDDIFVYETGTDLNLDPKAPVAYWDAKNWDGTDTILNSSGSIHDAIAVGGGATIPTLNSDSTGTFLTFDGGDYLEVPDHADLDFSLTEDLTMMVVGRAADVTPAANQVLLAKKLNFTSAGYVLYLRPAGNVGFQIADGAFNPLDTSLDLTDNAPFALEGIRNITDDNIEAFRDGTGSGTPTGDSTTATLANALALRIGRFSSAGTAYFGGDIYAAALWRRAMASAEVAYIAEVLKL